MTTPPPTDRAPDALTDTPLYQTLVHETADPAVALDGTIVDASDDVRAIADCDVDELRGDRARPGRVRSRWHRRHRRGRS